MVARPVTKPYSDASDEVLARQAAGGDVEAFEAFYSRHSSQLYDFVIRSTRDAELARDIVQETFVKMGKPFPGSATRLVSVPGSTQSLAIAR